MGRCRNRHLMHERDFPSGYQIACLLRNPPPQSRISPARGRRGVGVTFSIEAYEKNDAGDLHVCVDVDAGIPALSMIYGAPSYVFWKRTDGSVHYGGT